MNITYRQVDAFNIVISTGNVTEAAKVLGISQPAVSRLIADFESEVGYTLFQRKGRVLVPTDEARLLVKEVRQAVSGMMHIKDAAKAIGKFGHARINLVTVPGFSAELVPDLVSQFYAKMPNALVHVEIEANDDSIEWMVSQNFDFGITTSQPANPGFEHMIIRSDAVFCVVPEGHALTTKTSLDAKDFVGWDFISYMPGSRFRFEVDSFFEEKGIERNLHIEARTSDLICRLVAHGLGISIVGASRSHLETIPGCIAIPFTVPPAFRATLFWKRNPALPTVAKTFLGVARELINDQEVY